MRETREAVSCVVSEQQLESTASINRWWGVGLRTGYVFTYTDIIRTQTPRT